MWLVASLWDSPTAKAPNEKSPNFRKHQNQHEGVVKTQISGHNPHPESQIQ